MARITFIEPDGAAQEVDVPDGTTLMEGAVFNGVRGILADCAGDGGCATCHIYVHEAWSAKAGARSAKEKNTLRFALNPDATSRLACQIIAAPELDGMIVRLPKRQF